MEASLHALFLYDVAESIDLEAVPQPRRTSPEKPLGFDKPPVAIHSEQTELRGHAVEIVCKAFEFGVLSTSLRFPFSGSWEELVHASHEILDDQAVEACARSFAQRALTPKFTASIREPYAEWLHEDYMVIVTPIQGTATELVAQHGHEIARMVRGEVLPLSKAEEQEVMGSAMSCYSSDLLVVGWAAAFVSDSAEGAEADLQLLEYGNSQLLEFRHYEQRILQMLRELDPPAGTTEIRHPRRRIVRDTGRLNTLRLDVMEVAARSDNAVRLFGDMFYARAYRTIASRIGVDDYRRLLEKRLAASGELYHFLVDQINHRRAYALEFLVVLILVVELVLFLWKEMGK
jgi:hypothetical protein